MKLSPSRRLFIASLVLQFLFQFSPHKVFAQVKPAQFFLHGHILHMDGQKIFFSYKGLGNERVWDTTLITGGSFTFRGNIFHPAKALLTILDSNRTSTIDPNVTMPLFIEPAAMRITLRKDHFREAKLTGSITQNELVNLLSAEKYGNELDGLVLERNTLEVRFNSNNSSGSNSLSGLIQSISKLNSKIDLLSKRVMQADRKFFRQHPSSYITVYKIVDNIRHYDLQELRLYYNRMSARVRASEYGLQLQFSMANLSKGSPGSMASDFASIGINKDTISLRKFAGKYVLLDFWASWCKPCRAGNPELKKLFYSYNKDVVFIGLASDDRSVEQWKSAVVSDGIGLWPQGLAGSIGDLYHVQGLPTKILINPEGRIIGRYGTEDGEPEERLPSKLAKLFKKHS